MAITTRATLPSGLEVELTMPDLFSILATVGAVPSQQVLDMINLLTEDRVYRPTPPGVTADQSQIARQVRFLRGVTAIAMLCITSPEGLKPADLTWADLEAVYFGFFRGHRRSAHQSDPTGADLDVDGDQGVSTASGDVGD
jgi:hypothetical protein